MMKFGRFEVETVNFGFFRLDGGAMFGVVPKVIWSEKIEPDADNRIQLATRSLLIHDGERVILVDVGIGDKNNEKFRKMFVVQNIPTPAICPDEITDVVISHLHFDHAGALTRRMPDGALEPAFAKARVFVQEENWRIAHLGHPREKASYLAENFDILEGRQLCLLEGESEIYPGIWVHLSHGHTRGMQWLELRDGGRSIAYPSDLLPTSHHMPVPYHMGYDMCAETLMREREILLTQALEHKWIVVFKHDPTVASATVRRDERGHFAVDEIIEL